MAEEGRVSREIGYDTPEEAALAGFPRGQARVLNVWTTPTCSVSLGDDEVEIELATNEPPHEYPYFIHVDRRGDLWFELSSHN